jgi:hypothetical protein
MARQRTLSPAQGAATGKHRLAKDADPDEDVAKTESQCVLDLYSNIKPLLTLDLGKSLRLAHSSKNRRSMTKMHIIFVQRLQPIGRS